MRRVIFARASTSRWTTHGRAFSAPWCRSLQARGPQSGNSPSRGTRRFPRAHCRRLRVSARWQRRSGTIPLRWSRKSSPNMPREVTWRRRLQWATSSSRAIARRCLSSSRRGRSPASRRSRSQVCRPCASKAHRPRSVSRSAHRLRRAPSVRHVSDSSATTATVVIAMRASTRRPAWRRGTDVSI